MSSMTPTPPNQAAPVVAAEVFAEHAEPENVEEATPEEVAEEAAVIGAINDPANAEIIEHLKPHS